MNFRDMLRPEDNGNGDPGAGNGGGQIEGGSPPADGGEAAPAAAFSETLIEAPNFAPGQELTSEQIGQLLRYDPVAHYEQLQRKKAADEAAAPAQPKAPAPAGTPPPAAAPPVAAPAPAQAPVTIDQLTQVLKTLQQGQAQPAAPAQPAEPQPAYAITLPDQLIAAIDSDDAATRRQGLNVLVNGMANMIHNNTLKLLQQQVLPTVQNQIQTAVQSTQTQQEVHKNFYSQNPELDNPALKPLVVEIATRYAQELGEAYPGPTAEFLAQVATRTKTHLNAMFSAINGKPPAAVSQAGGAPRHSGQTPPHATQSTPTPSPGRFISGGAQARPPAAFGQYDESADIMDTFGLPGRPN